MIDSQKIVQMVKSIPTTIRGVYPDIGLEVPPGPVLTAMADGPKLAFLSVNAGSQPKVYSAFLLSLEDVNGTLVAEVSGESTKKLISFSRTPVGTPEDDAYDQAEDMYIDSKENHVLLMQEALDRLTEPTKPDLSYKIEYVEWATLDDTGIHPAGIIVLSADGTKLRGVSFPGYEREARRWDRWESVAPGLLGELDSRIGRTATASGPMEMYGQNMSDAIDRAMYNFATKVYMTTKRSPYQ